MMKYSGGFTRLFLLLVAALAAAPAAVSGRPQDDGLFGKPIRSIQYESDQPLERSRYDRTIGLEPGMPLTRSGLKSAIQALYDTGSFSEIAVSAKPEADGVRLGFQLCLSLFFNHFFLEGSVDLGGRYPSEVITLPVGERYSPQKLEEAGQAVVSYMRDLGFYQVAVKARTEANQIRAQIDTYFEVEAGELATIRAIVIGGVPSNEATILRERLGFREGQKYRRDRFRKRLDNVKEYLVGRGFLDAEPQLAESYRPDDNSVALDLSIANFGRVRVEVEGFKIPKDQLRRLLPVLLGEGLRSDLLEEGTANLREYLEERGYPESSVSIQESRDDAGLRLVRYIIERGRKVTVSEVRFRGNQAFTDSYLLQSIQIRPARFLQKSPYSVSRLDSDVESLQNLYFGAGYLDALVIPLVESLENGEKLRITFECEEGPQARTGAVEIAPRQLHLSAETLTARMRLKEGAPYSPLLAEYDRQAILSVYSDEGYMHSAVTYQAEEIDGSHVYRIVFQVQEGVQSRVGRVVVLGKDRTRDSVIEKRIQLKSDDPLSLGKMLDSQRALYGTGVFDVVRVTAQNPEKAVPYQNVIVRVREAKPITVRYGFGYQEREKVRGILELSDLNILGLGQRVDLRLRGSAVEQAGALSFQQPHFRFLPVDSYFTFSGSKRSEVSFDVRRVHLTYQYGRPVNDHTWGLLRYQFTNVLVSNNTAELIRKDTPRNLSTVSAIYINDTRDNYLDPMRGFFTSTDLSITSKLPRALLGSGHYVSLFTQNSYYRTLRGPLRLASYLRFGFIHPFAGDRNVPISERLFAGGASTLRGFETDRAGPLGPSNEPVGGNALLIGNLELRLPLVSRLEMSGFYDGGNVFLNLSSIRLSDVSHTVGVGLRIRTPFGPIRLDYGVNLNLPPHLKVLGYKAGHFSVTIGPSF